MASQVALQILLKNSDTKSFFLAMSYHHHHHRHSSLFSQSLFSTFCNLSISFSTSSTCLYDSVSTNIGIRSTHVSAKTFFELGIVVGFVRLSSSLMCMCENESSSLYPVLVVKPSAMLDTRCIISYQPD